VSFCYDNELKDFKALQILEYIEEKNFKLIIGSIK